MQLVVYSAPKIVSPSSSFFVWASLSARFRAVSLASEHSASINPIPSLSCWLVFRACWHLSTFSDKSLVVKTCFDAYPISWLGYYHCLCQPNHPLPWQYSCQQMKKTTRFQYQHPSIVSLYFHLIFISSFIYPVKISFELLFPIACLQIFCATSPNDSFWLDPPSRSI